MSLSSGLRIWDRWLRDHDAGDELPRIVPLVVYAGDVAWNAPTAVEALVEGPDASWVPRMSFILDDLSQMSDEALQDRQLTVFAELVVLALSRLRQSPRPLELVEAWLPSLRRLLAAQNGLERFRALIEYLAAVADVEPEALQPVVRQLGPAAEDTAMTLAERLRQQGLEKGLEQGLEKGLEQGLEQGRLQKAVELMLRLLQVKFRDLPEPIRTQVENGTEPDFARWTERFVRAETLEQVFDDTPLSD